MGNFDLKVKYDTQLDELFFQRTLRMRCSSNSASHLPG